jgi:hypothetical protein
MQLYGAILSSTGPYTPRNWRYIYELRMSPRPSIVGEAGRPFGVDGPGCSLQEKRVDPFGWMAPDARQIVSHDLLPRIPTAHDVVNRTRMLNPQPSSHAAIQPSDDARCKEKP